MCKYYYRCGAMLQTFIANASGTHRHKRGNSIPDRVEELLYALGRLAIGKTIEI